MKRYLAVLMAMTLLATVLVPSFGQAEMFRLAPRGLDARYLTDRVRIANPTPSPAPYAAPLMGSLPPHLQATVSGSKRATDLGQLGVLGTNLGQTGPLVGGGRGGILIGADRQPYGAGIPLGGGVTPGPLGGFVGERKPAAGPLGIGTVFGTGTVLGTIAEPGVFGLNGGMGGTDLGVFAGISGGDRPASIFTPTGVAGVNDTGTAAGWQPAQTTAAAPRVMATESTGSSAEKPDGEKAEPLPGSEPGRVAVPETTGSEPGDQTGGKDDERKSRDRDGGPGVPPPPKPPVKYPPLYNPPNSGGSGTGATGLTPGATSSSVPSGGITSEPVQIGSPSGGGDTGAGSTVVPGDPPKAPPKSWPVESVRVTSDDVAIVPLRRTFQPLGADIWTAQGYVWARMRGHTVRMKVGSAQVMVYQGDSHQLRQWRKEVFLYKSEVYVPLRDTSDALGVAISEVNGALVLR